MRLVPFAAFFLSGASSLIFQALWTRMLHHTFGATSVAMSTVLTAFMAGLGLGARMLGARASRIARPLMAYAVCELGVAACAAVIPLLVTSDGPLAMLNATLRTSLGAESFGFMVARFVCVFPLLVVPTTLMGGTLPLLAQHFVRGESSERTSAQVGTLYAINTLGAVAGTLLGSFVLMPAWGVRATNWVAVSINLLLGLVVLFLARGSKDKPNAQQAQVTAQVSRSGLPEWARVLAVVTFAVSGACAMAYEVVWSRALSMAIGSSMQAFALILVTFLIGIAAGSAVVSRFLNERAATRDSLLTLALVSCALSLLALAPAIVLSSAPLALGAWAITACIIAGICIVAIRRARELEVLEEELGDEISRLLEQAGRRVLALPVALSLCELVRFVSKRSNLAAVTQHGYLPYITTAVVLCIAAFFVLVTWLWRRPFVLAGGVQLSIACATFASYAFQDEIPYSFARMVSAVEDLSTHVGTVRFFMFFAAGLCTLPATLGMGAMFPITLELWRKTNSNVGADVGTVYAANTAGSILGSWLPGFVLLPRIGMEATLLSGMLLNGLVASALLWASPRATSEAHGSRFLALLSSAFVLGLLAVAFVPSSPFAWNLSHMTLGVFRVSLAREVLDTNSWGAPDLVYYRDGVSTTVSVERWGRHLSLKNNGKVDASNGDDMPTQIMVAAYPLLLHTRGAKDLEVAIVGFGSGVTVGAALQFPVRHIDTMELERAVVEAAVDYFADVSHLPRKQGNFPYVDEPRLTLHNDDGRNYLASTPKRYDVIISEPSNPWITGVSDLFTVDHFRISKRKLAPGGVYCQWVQLYEMSPENIKTIYRTFASQFRYVLAFAAEELSSDTILVGSDSPLPIDLTHVARAMEDRRVAAELERAYVHSPYDVWSRILFASKAEVLAFTQRELRKSGGRFREVMRATGQEPCPFESCRREPVELNTDDNMLIELRAPSDLIGFSRYEGYLSLFYGDRWPYGELAFHLRGLDTPRAKADLALALLAGGRKRQARAQLSSIAGAVDAKTELARTTAELLLGARSEPALELEPPSPGPQMSPAARRSFARALREIDAALARRDFARALQTMEDIPTPLRNLSGPGFRFLYGILLYRGAGDDRTKQRLAVSELEDLIRKDEVYTRAHPEIFYFLARALYRASSFDKAVRNMRAYVALLPQAGGASSPSLRN